MTAEMEKAIRDAVTYACNVVGVEGLREAFGMRAQRARYLAATKPEEGGDWPSIGIEGTALSK